MAFGKPDDYRHAIHVIHQDSYHQEQWTQYSHIEDSKQYESSEEIKDNKKLTSKWQRKRAYEMTLPLHIRQKRRTAANARERKRMNNLNISPLYLKTLCNDICKSSKMNCGEHRATLNRYF